jgi:general stress protein 26
MAETSKTDAEKREHLKKIINDASIAFLVTKHEDHLHGRPMATAKIEGQIESLWFASERNSGKVEQIKADPHVFAGYTNSSGSEWASLNGQARIVDDATKKKELWSPVWKNWFSGPEDPNMVLIEVKPGAAEYWDSGSRIVQMAKFAVTAVTGAKTDPGEHGKVKVGAQ